MYVQAIGIDRIDDEYVVTLQMFQAGEYRKDNASKASMTTISGKGDTILTAITDAEMRQSKGCF